MSKINFMMSLKPEIYKRLEPYLKHGVTLQELLRARIIPEWIDGPAVVARKAYARGYKAGGKKIQNGNR